MPWVQPWGTAAAKAPLAMPKNAATGRQYSGINVLILWGAVIEHGFPAQGWLTFAKRSRSAAMCARANTAPPSSMPTALCPMRRSGARRETGEEAPAIPFLKRFTVFNPAQCENLPAESRPSRRRRCRA